MPMDHGEAPQSAQGRENNSQAAMRTVNAIEQLRGILRDELLTTYLTIQLQAGGSDNAEVEVKKRVNEVFLEVERIIEMQVKLTGSNSDEREREVAKQMSDARIVEIVGDIDDVGMVEIIEAVDAIVQQHQAFKRV